MQEIIFINVTQHTYCLYEYTQIVSSRTFSNALARVRRIKIIGEKSPLHLQLMRPRAFR